MGLRSIQKGKYKRQPQEGKAIAGRICGSCNDCARVSRAWPSRCNSPSWDLLCFRGNAISSYPSTLKREKGQIARLSCGLSYQFPAIHFPASSFTSICSGVTRWRRWCCCTRSCLVASASYRLPISANTLEYKVVALSPFLALSPTVPLCNQNT